MKDVTDSRQQSSGTAETPPTHPEGADARMPGMTDTAPPDAVQPNRIGGGPPPASAAARPGGWRPGIAAAALVGVIAMGLAIGLAELLAALGQWIGLLHAPSSPLSSLGQTFIQFTPEWLKEFAIQTFGENDKDALRAGMGITLLVVAVVIGIVGRRSPRLAVAITGVLILVTAAAVLSRAGASLVDVLPIVIGGAAGIALLVSVFRLQVVDPPVDGMAAGAAVPTGRAAAAAGAGSVVASPQTAAATGPVTDRADEPKPGRSGPAHPMGLVGAGAANRRQFFRIAGIGALAAVAAGALARWIPSAADVAASRDRVALPTPRDVQQVDLAAVQIDTAGITPFVTDNAEFYRVDTAFVVPRITTEDWQLKIHGSVDREITLSYADLIAMPSVERMITLTCVSNEVGGDLAGNARWQGVRIADVLAMAGPRSGADCVLSTSVDGFTVTTPLEALTDDRDALLAFAMNGEPLPVEHGFPVRMVVPGLYGYVSATKWVVDLNVTTFAGNSAYWTDRGWSAQAPIKTQSRIDVPKSFEQISKGTVAVAGVAWAQHRGITGVQVQIDDGEWQDAKLSGEVSTDTWRQWLYQWDAQETGTHTIRCRAVDPTGVQTDQVQGVMPDGATGWDSRSVTVTA
jgi:DMSO/TMAO reductase YedYZ molybdopterin-dependent catalytic subunit